MTIFTKALGTLNGINKPNLNPLLLLFAVFTVFMLPGRAKSQNTTYKVRTGIYAGTAGELPFWFYSNINGKIDPSGTNFLNELSFHHLFMDNGTLLLSGGVNTVLRFSDDKSVHLSELYIQARAYGLQLDAGRFRQPIGLNNHQLSVGSMMVSDNAIPIPKISISTPEFMEVPFTDGFLQYKGMFSHGWLEGSRYVSNAFLHQKYFYLRVNAGSFSGTGGIIHNAQWGGESPQFGRLPQSFGDYLRLISGMGANPESNAPGGEISNVMGNSVAAYEFGLAYRHDQYRISVTRLFYLEDKVSTRFRSPWDGVWGANLTFDNNNGLLHAITYEHINTKNQDAKSWELIGRRDYYDNFVYRSGWTYENRTLGIPLILFDGTTITNNVLIGHHVGFKGKGTDNLAYRILFTYSRNYGVRDDWVSRGGDSIPNDRDDIIPREQFRQDQYSWLVQFKYTLQNLEGLQVDLSIGSDTGKLYANNLGVMAGVSYTGW